MIASIPVAGSQLLKHIHVTELQLIMFVYMVMKTGKEPVLIKIIIHDLLAEIDKHLIR